MKKVLLAYSGGLDTSVAIKIIAEQYGAEVSTLTVNVGQAEDLAMFRERALYIGAARAIVLDATEEFVREYIRPAVKANALYEGLYPLATALARPLIVKHLVRTAHEIGAEWIGHGCTGKGNDQVRFETALAALDPKLKVIAPMRELNLKRDYELKYAAEHDIPVETKATNYSIDENIWGRSIECGALEDANREPPEDAFAWTVAPEGAPSNPSYIEIEFSGGVPVKLGGEVMHPVRMIEALNRLGGQHGVGRIDHVESRLVGIKSREVYEAPAAAILIKAHQDLEKLVLSKDVLHYKPALENTFSELVYNGLWFSSLAQGLLAFFDAVQAKVSGTVTVKLFKGSATVVGRASPHSLYVRNLATYEGVDEFDQNAAKGFIDIWSLPLKVQSQVAGQSALSSELELSQTH
jgi:argininosuccinate synthase